MADDTAGDTQESIVAIISRKFRNDQIDNPNALAAAIAQAQEEGKEELSDRELLDLLFNVGRNLGKLWKDLNADRTGRMREYEVAASEAEEDLQRVEENLPRLGELLRDLLREFPNRTVRTELRNDLKNDLPDEVWSKLGLIVPRGRGPSPNSQFLLESPTPGDLSHKTDDRYSIRTSRERGLKITTMSASSRGISTADSQDAVSYNFTEWSDTGIPEGVLAIADGVTQSPLSGAWSRFICRYAAYVAPFNNEDKIPWGLDVIRSFVLIFREGEEGILHLHNIRENRERFNKVSDPSDISAAATFLQLTFGIEDIRWTSIGDCYLFSFDGEETRVESELGEVTNQPPVLSANFPPIANSGDSNKGEKRYDSIPQTHDKYYLIATTDQSGEYIKGDYGSMDEIIAISKRALHEVALGEWTELANKIWGPNDDRDDLTCVVMEFDTDIIRKGSTDAVSEYMDRMRTTDRQKVSEFLDKVDEEEEFEIGLLGGGSEKIKIKPWEPFGERVIEGAFASYYRLSKGKGLKVYSRQDIGILLPKLRNQYRISGLFNHSFGSLRFPNFKIVEYVNGTPVIAVLMEHIEGDRLQKIVTEKTNGTDDEYTDITLEQVEKNLFEALDAINKSGISHGDVCSGNVIVGPDGEVTLVDLDSLRCINLGKTDEAGKDGFHMIYHWKGGIDAFPFLVISLSLRLIQTDPDAYGSMISTDEQHLLFLPSDIKYLCDIGIEKLLEIDSADRPGSDQFKFLIEVIEQGDDADLGMDRICKEIRKSAYTPDWDRIRDLYRDGSNPLIDKRLGHSS